LQNEITEEMFKIRNMNVKIKYTYYEYLDNKIESRHYTALTPLLFLCRFSIITIITYKPWLT